MADPRDLDLDEIERAARAAKPGDLPHADVTILCLVQRVRDAERERDEWGAETERLAAYVPKVAAERDTARLHASNVEKRAAAARSAGFVARRDAAVGVCRAVRANYDGRGTAEGAAACTALDRARASIAALPETPDAPDSEAPESCGVCEHACGDCTLTRLICGHPNARGRAIDLGFRADFCPLAPTPPDAGEDACEGEGCPDDARPRPYDDGKGA